MRAKKEHSELGRWIRQYRMIHGLTQREFAKITGTSQPTIKGYEHGKVPHGTIIMKRLADAMGLSVDTLYGTLDSKNIAHANADNLTAIAKRSHKIAVSKEWWKDYDESPGRWKPYVLATKIALITSEVSEALEEARQNQYKKYMVGKKPEGVVVELADAIIRIFDLCERLGLDLKSALLEKLDYNETRPVKHGNKVF